MKKELTKILFIDDDQDIHTIVIFALKNMPQVEVLSAYSGKEGIKIAQSYLPDLILLDVMMPSMDGIETLQELKKIPDLERVPVVFLTAKVEKSEVESYLKYGVANVIIKPFNVNTLYDQLLAVWNQSQDKS